MAYGELLTLLNNNYDDDGYRKEDPIISSLITDLFKILMPDGRLPRFVRETADPVVEGLAKVCRSIGIIYNEVTGWQYR